MRPTVRSSSRRRMASWTLRQLVRCGERWQLRALNPAYAATPLADLASVRGVVIQKRKPGRRRALKRYVD